MCCNVCHVCVRFKNPTNPNIQLPLLVIIGQNGYCSRNIILYLQFKRFYICYISRYYSWTIKQNSTHWLLRMHAMLHREYHAAHYARVGDTNNEQLALLLSLLLLKLVEFAKVGLCVTNAFLGFAKLNVILIAALKIVRPMKISDRARLSFFQTTKWWRARSNCY